MRRAVLAALLTVTAATPAAAAAAPRPPAGATHELVTLTSAHRVISSLRGHSTRVTTIQASRPITGGPTVLPVLARATRGGEPWVRVRLPGRPNSGEGWTPQRGTVGSSTTWRLVVSTSRRQVIVHHAGRVVRTFGAVVGKPSTPTPLGHFFVEESVRMLPGHPGGPFALALSARSNVLQEFEGGPGQIAIHGIDDLGGIPGTAVSHGCVRLGDVAIRWLAARIGPGVSVTIT